MAEFFEALTDPDIAFVRHALFVGLLASVAFGILGSYVVVRRTTYIADAIAHCVLGGIGAAYFLRYNMGVAWADPMLGAVVAALVAALGVGLVTLYAREREDTVISVVWVSGVAIGLLLLDKASPPPGEPSIDPLSYLIGDILLISRFDLALVAALDATVIVLVTLFRNKLAAVCFDDEFSELRGLRAKGYYLFLLVLTALTVVLLVRVVGVLMVVALLVLPAALAGRFASRLWQMMLLAMLLCATFVTVGLGLSYVYQLLTGPTIIALAAATYLVVAAVKRE
jgi:zinc transport system permease protein